MTFSGLENSCGQHLQEMDMILRLIYHPDESSESSYRQNFK